MKELVIFIAGLGCGITIICLWALLIDDDI